MRNILFCICLLSFQHLFAQVTETVIPNTEQQLENITENNGDVETEDDAYLQQLMQLIKNPIELNEVNEPDLSELRMLTPLQVQSFILYRKLAGKLIDIYELQAIPGWDISVIQKIRPYVTVSTRVTPTAALKARLKNGEHQLLLRLSQVPERSKGYLADSSTATNYYPGSPQKILVRYKYDYKRILQYGIVAEKDAGEQFFKGRQKQGFDFYAAHVFIRRLGIIRSLAVGDFVVNLGQGLIQWQSLAFKKGPDVLNIKREGEVIKPYNAAGEINFHRGIAITLSKNNWQFSAFGSYRNLDANFITDTAQSGTGYVSSLQTSGYHRTKSEADDKAKQRQIMAGANLSYQFKKLHIGINTVGYRFKYPVQKSADPYNKFAINGNRLANYSFDYSYTFRNLHLFGEAAFTADFSKAFVQGLLISVSSLADISLLYRNISKTYQSLYSNAFTEGASPANESGLYAGISLRPSNSLRLDAYADIYRFPWLKYRVDAPSTGSEYLVQLSYKPGKQLEVYSRYQYRSKAIDENAAFLTLAPVMQQPKINWRTQISYKINTVFTIRCRNELVWYNKKGGAPEQGYLLNVDFIYKPARKPFSGNIRLQYFDTDGYNSRLYAYENDVLYSYSIPFFYEKGQRYYVNINYDINKSISIWLKWSQTLYQNKTLIGSGLDEIKGKVKSEIKLQAAFRF